MKKLLFLFGLLFTSSTVFGQCQADFNYTIQGLSGTVDFTDNSVGSVVSYSWTFGDGGTSSAANPSHTYTNTDLYGVCLSIIAGDSINPNSCQSYVCDSIYVVVDSMSNCDASADFDVNQNGTINGTATSAGANGYLWGVYDNSWTFLYSSSTNPLSYNPGQDGMYNVCLTTYDNQQMVCDSACYQVYVTDSISSGCNANATFDVNPNGTITGTATSTGAYGFLWDVYDASWNYLYSSGSNPLSYNPGQDGNYNICLVAYDSMQYECDSSCYVVYVGDSVQGINELNDISLGIYPNPTENTITVVIDDYRIDHFTISDISGVIILEQELLGVKTQINLSQLPKGMYFIHAIGETGERLTYSKVIKL